MVRREQFNWIFWAMALLALAEELFLAVDKTINFPYWSFTPKMAVREEVSQVRLRFRVKWMIRFSSCYHVIHIYIYNFLGLHQKYSDWKSFPRKVHVLLDKMKITPKIVIYMDLEHKVHARHIKLYNYAWTDKASIHLLCTPCVPCYARN